MHVQKAINFILKYKATHQHLSCNMLFGSLLCVHHPDIRGQNLVMHDFSTQYLRNDKLNVDA